MANPQLLTLPNGRVLEAWDIGPRDGRPLVFLHGTPSSGIPYASMGEAFAGRGLRTITWSRPGYGDSSRQPGRSVGSIARDLADVLDVLEIPRVHVAGWSGGGPHALACAALAPEHVIATAVIAGIAPYPAEGLDYMAGMGEENVEEFTAALENPQALIGFKERYWPIFRVVTGAEVAEAYGDLIDDVDRGSLTGTFAEDVAASYRDGLRNSYWGWFDDDMAFVKPWGFELSALTGPVHIWQGAHDRMVPYAHGEWLAGHIPGAIPHLSADDGHLTLVVGSIGRILDDLLAS